MADGVSQVSVKPVEQPLNLIPVGLKEAALDSPTFRASSAHFEDQIDVIERWLEGYIRAASRLITELNSLELTVNSFLTQSAPPNHISEAVLDHDYTLLAVRRYGEGAREFWNQTFRGFKKYDHAVLEPIRSFLNNDLRAFKDTRRMLDLQQKSFDAVIARYLSQSKTKEASSLREDAFQLHEARKAYLKASMEYCVSAPQVRASLDQLVVRIFTEQFKDMKNSRDANAATFARLTGEMERIKGWSKEMENSERAFKRELVTARKQIEDNALDMIKPSRELHDYELLTVPYASIGASTATAKATGVEKGEKQGWLFLKTLVGKPTRTIWVRRWFYVKNGIFGWLVQGSRSGGVEESEKTGVLLCGIRPATQEERRFCFEVKTKDTSIVLQAESQPELTDWITSFEFAKRKALQDPASTEMSAAAAGLDPAFAVTPPVAPEFAARVGDAERGEEAPTGLSIPGSDSTGLGIQQRASFDVTASRRVASIDREGESSTSRIISKLDLHKRPGNSPQVPQVMPPAGGIASLISASHNAMPISPATPQSATADGVSGVVAGTGLRRHFTLTLSTLAPNSLANPPAPTNLSHTAVVVSGERNVSLGSKADGSGMPGGIMANLWGSSNWGYVNRLTDEVLKTSPQKLAAPIRPPLTGTSSVDDVVVMDGAGEMITDKPALTAPGTDLATLGHRKTSSTTAIADSNNLTSQIARPGTAGGDDYPSNYPLSLKAQYAQFRVLFPSAPQTEKLVLVFRATWNPNEQQEFPGRVYVTTKEIYIYSHHLGFVLITGVSLSSITDVTAAPGRDCDYVYLHLKEANRLDHRKRITVRVFLDPLRLLQRRLNYLVQNANSDQPATLEEVIKNLLKMEAEKPTRSSSADSWEAIPYDVDDAVAGDDSGPFYHRERNVKASLRIDGNLYGETARTGREIRRFQLPRHPVVYAPQDMQTSITREFNVSAKALFHVMYGDKSAVFQLLYCNRWGDKIIQTPWVINATEHWQRRFTSETSPIQDHQTIDISNDHLCYLVTNNRVPWRLPYSNRFHLTTKLVITHVAKSRCKLAIFQRISWYKAPAVPYIRHLIEKLALNTLEADALDLTNVIMDQVAKLGNHSKTNKAIEVFGNIGQQTSVPQLDAKAMPDIANAPALAVGASANRMQRVSLFRLVSSDLMVKMLRAVSMAFDILIALGKGAVRICTAHTLLIIVLVFSIFYNGWHGYRDGLVSWHERSASRYMARMGVKPDLMMGKGIFLSDIDELVAPPLSVAMVNRTDLPFIQTDSIGNKTCRSTFTEEVLTDLPHHAGAGARLQRSRGALARYRHDLLVALRVVNRVEKDIVLSEWEEWVRVEERKCAKVGNLLRGSEDAGGLDELVLYCDSCRAEVAGLEGGREYL